MLTVWRGDGVRQQQIALKKGIPVISPQHGCYYDWEYAGNSTRKVYEWNPVAANVPREQRRLVRGGQAALWTERISTQNRVEWMLFPRICALAEVLWTVESGKDWNDFYRRLVRYYPVMKKIGINYYEDDALNEKEFRPSDEKPALVRSHDRDKYSGELFPITLNMHLTEDPIHFFGEAELSLQETISPCFLEKHFLSNQSESNLEIRKIT